MHPDPGSTTVSVCENAKRSSYLTEKDVAYSRTKCEHPRPGKRDSAFPWAVVQGEQFCNILVETEQRKLSIDSSQIQWSVLAKALAKRENSLL